jgi:hypothetical protein
MASIKPVKNNAKVGTSTAGFPKGVQNKRTNNKATVPSTMKNGGMKKGKMC